MVHVGLAGAGIGGLAAALALAQAGCRVSIFERTAALAEVGAGLQLSPNATAVLRRLGVLAQVERDAVAPLSLRIGRGRDGAILARMPLGDAAGHRFGAPFLVTLRADLQAALLEAACDHPHVEIATGASLASWSTTQAGVTLAFEDGGPSVTVDALVGCDGLRSVVRDQLGLASARVATATRRTAWRATIEASTVPMPFTQPNSNLWLGPKAHLVHYPVAAGRWINLVAAVDERRPGNDGDSSSAMPGDPGEIQRRFASWAEPIRQLVAAPKAWGTWPLLDRPPLARWSRGPVTLLGDAAHPMLPFLAQGAAQAIEDAWALGEAVRAFSHDLPRAFAAYEKSRLSRTARVQSESRRQALIYHLPAPLSVARDLVLQMTPADKLLARYDWLYKTHV